MALEDFRIRFGKLVTETIGTAVLVMVIQLAPGTPPISIGLVLIALAYSGGPISGGHYNPAVSLALFVRGSVTWASLLLYWIFQFAGAFAGALLGALIGGNYVAFAKGSEYYLLQAFLAELLFTALLCYVFLACCSNSKVDGNSYYGLAIGLTVVVGTLCVSHISGAVFNPAIATALSLVHGIREIAYMLWIVLAQACGGIAGALLFYIVEPTEFTTINAEARALLSRNRNQAEQEETAE